MSTGVLPFNELKRLVTLNTGFFESSQYTEDAQMSITAGNFDGAGMSGGLLQYNFGPADRLQELFLHLVNNYDAVVNTAFGANTTEASEFKNVIKTYTRAQRVTWGDSITDYAANAEGRVLKEPWKTSFANLLVTAESKTKYYSMRDAYYWPNPYDLFRQMSCTSRMAIASLFDLVVNKGRYYPINLLQVDFDTIDANDAIDATEKERQKIAQINIRGNEEENGLNDTSSSYFIQRRSCMRDQGGTYYGNTYDPDVQFDMNQEPATDEKAGSGGALNIKLGSISVTDIFLGTVAISAVYLGTTLLNSGGTTYTTNIAPQTQFRTNPNSYLGIGAVTDISLISGQPLWVDVENYIACRTYYTTDGSTPTTASTLYTGPITLSSSTTLKVLTVSIFGVAEAVKTLNVTVTTAPVTTISPSVTTQNAIPITVTLTTDEVGAAIKYKLGSSATVYNYTGPFQVTQTSPGVASANIKVTYYAIGANATETEKSITYNTAGAIPGKPTVTVTNGANQVKLDWTSQTNATSYSVYRSTTLGTLGAVLVPSQYQTAVTYTDTTAVGGTTYYYTVRSANYGTFTDSDQMTALPTTGAPAKPTWRYIKFEGYGTSVDATTRGIELEVWSGGTNRVLNKTILSAETVSTGTGTPAMMINGTKTTTANTYPIWWSTIPNGRVVIDMGAQYAIDKVVYCSYSISGTQRANRFKILGSNTNNGTDWTEVWNMSTTTDLQPILPAGYEITF